MRTHRRDELIGIIDSDPFDDAEREDRVREVLDRFQSDLDRAKVTAAVAKLHRAHAMPDPRPRFPGGPGSDRTNWTPTPGDADADDDLRQERVAAVDDAEIELIQACGGTIKPGRIIPAEAGAIALLICERETCECGSCAPRHESDQRLKLWRLRWASNSGQHHRTNFDIVFN